MAGETNLDKLLADMAPELLPGEFVFTTIDGGQYGDLAELSPIASFIEPEGLTLVLPREQAENQDLAFEASFRCITLTIHSSLEAVGLTAAVASKLAQHGISANVIAAYYHDHVFVGSQDAERALVALAEFRA